MATKPSNRQDSRKKGSVRLGTSREEKRKSPLKNYLRIPTEQHRFMTNKSSSANSQVAEVREEYLLNNAVTTPPIPKKQKQPLQSKKSEKIKFNSNPEDILLKNEKNRKGTLQKQTSPPTTQRRPKQKQKVARTVKKSKQAGDVSINNKSKSSSRNKSCSFKKRIPISLSQRILQHADVVLQLAQKYKQTIEELEQKESDQLGINSKYQSTGSKILTTLSKQTIQIFRQTISLWEELKLSADVEISCEIVYQISRIPESYLHFQSYRWLWITLMLMNKLKPGQESSITHLNNLINYCKSNYYLHLTNVLEDAKVDDDTYQLLALDQKRLIPAQKREKSITQNTIIIQSIVLMLVECNEMLEIELCLVQQKEEQSFKRQFFRMWRGENLYPIVPSFKEQEFTICIDLDAVMIFKGKGKMVSIRPYSAQLIRKIPREIEIVVYSSMGQQHLQEIIKQIDPQDVVSQVLPRYSINWNSPQVSKLLNRQLQTILLLSSNNTSINTLQVSLWSGSEYDNQLMTVISDIEARFKSLSL